MANMSLGCTSELSFMIFFGSFITEILFTIFQIFSEGKDNNLHHSSSLYIPCNLCKGEVM